MLCWTLSVCLSAFQRDFSERDVLVFVAFVMAVGSWWTMVCRHREHVDTRWVGCWTVSCFMQTLWSFYSLLAVLSEFTDKNFFSINSAKKVTEWVKTSSRRIGATWYSGVTWWASTQHASVHVTTGVCIRIKHHTVHRLVEMCLQTYRCDVT